MLNISTCYCYGYSLDLTFEQNMAFKAWKGYTKTCGSVHVAATKNIEPQHVIGSAVAQW